MSIAVSDSRRFVPRYLLFCLVFAILLALLIGVSRELIGYAVEVSALPKDDGQTAFPTVVIDAGHGGEDGGAVGKSGVYEKDLNLAIAALLSEQLRACGIRTVMTRTEDILLYDPASDYRGQKKVQDLATRRRIAEEQKNAVFVSIHMNAFPQERYSGLQVYCSPHHPDSLLLAETIRERVCASLQPDNRRAVKIAGSEIFLLDRLSCPAVLVECGFLSNAEECARLEQGEYRQQLALCISMSILETFCADRS
ncbi:MAG: N-acetylmuramoyl-L-alanine amidase [Ruminococcaceae bacterium]|nr:N-acetylmuramoyl-L-alanine amidase [Oscillospiraceae bacterium]